MSMRLADPRVAIAYMVLSVRRGNGRTFVVLLSEYKIEGTPYRANLLTVSPGHLSDMSFTDLGFRGRALFPGEILNARDRRKGRRQSNGIYSVQLEVELRMIQGIHVEHAPGAGSFEALLE
jgi:hypothetical protein